MSRIGKLPITIPENVDVNYSGSEITVKGKFGTEQNQLPDSLSIEQNEGKLIVNLKTHLNAVLGFVVSDSFGYLYCDKRYPLLCARLPAVQT